MNLPCLAQSAKKSLCLVLAAVIACWFLLGHWLAIPLSSLISLGCLATALLLAATRPAIRTGNPLGGTLTIGWAASLAFAASFWFEKHRAYVPDLSYAWLAWLVAVAVLGTSLGLDRSPERKRWQALAMSWALAGSALYLLSCYLQNDRLGFHLALLVALALLVLCLVGFRLPYPAVLSVNTLLLILALLPVVDLFVRPKYEMKPQDYDGSRRLYSYEAARRDPEAFAEWWQLYYEQFHKMEGELGSSGSPNHTSVLPPHAHATFFQSQIRINNKGFRGPDIPDEKGDAYRIVALGESTTFGATLQPGDRPWPEVLEQIIRERLAPRRPVQVINAGICAFTLSDNLGRLPAEILPLKPDMIISYHGINGFTFLEPSLPLLGAPKAPAYQPRPLKLLAQAEYGLKIRMFRAGRVPKSPPARIARLAPLDTEYAQAYQQLIGVALTNQIRLVLANFSMAVNQQSDPDVIAFYRPGFPSVYWQIQANILHSTLIHELTKKFPEVREADTHPNLDGQHDKFIDLIHFTQQGDIQLAENIFTSIKDILETDLRRND
jgi:lysophospholipase L1-like esterase